MVQNAKKVKTYYCFRCMTLTYNTQKDKQIIRSKVIREKLRCFNCNHKKSTFLQQRKRLKLVHLEFFNSYKTCWLFY